MVGCGGLYFSIDWGAKKFPGFQMDWSPHWMEGSNSPSTWTPRSSLDSRWTGARIEDINPGFFQSHYLYHLEKTLTPD